MQRGCVIMVGRARPDFTLEIIKGQYFTRKLNRKLFTQERLGNWGVAEPLACKVISEQLFRRLCN